MRSQFQKLMSDLHIGLIEMSALCEDAIACATKALIDDDDYLREKAISLESEINLREHELEQLCVRLILHQQPIAGDLRLITAAQGMITDLERIGDQAQDIAELSVFMKGSAVKSDVHISDMAKASVKMVTESIDSYVNLDLDKAKKVVEFDDIIDNLFYEVKKEIIEMLTRNSSLASDCLDLLMIAKYLERIGDHAENIAQWVLYAITGSREIENGGALPK